MIFFISGQDIYRAQQTVDAIRAKFQANVDPTGHNVFILDAEQSSGEDIFNQINSQGFLVSKKLIVIKNIFELTKLETFEPLLLDWLNKQEDSAKENYVIFWQQSDPPKTSTLTKRLKKFKYNYTFPLLSDSELTRWVADQCRRWHCTITGEAINLLIAYVGNNTWQLAQEIHKLCHTGEQTISAQSVRQNVNAKTADTIFQLVDACAARNQALAQSLINAQLQAGTEPLYLLAMLTRQFRLLARALDISSQVKNSYALAETLKIHPFVAKKILSQVKHFDRTDLTKIYRLLLSADRQLKYTPQAKGAIFTALIQKI